MHGRVLFFIDSLGAGGAQRQILRVLSTLYARGYDVRLLYYQPDHHYLPLVPAEIAPRLRYVSLAHKPQDPRSLLRIRRAIQREAPDVVVALPRAAVMMVAAIRASGLRFQWIASERDSRLDLDRPARRWAYRAALTQAHLVVPNSRTAEAEILACGLRSERITYVPNGVDLPASAPSFERPDGPLNLLMVGRLVPAKNPLAALQALQGVNGDWRLDHLGRHDDDPELTAAWKELVLRNGWSDRVTLHGAQSDITSWYRRSHLLVHPSWHEGFPNVVLEAWVHGCPVLVSDQGDLPHLVTHGQTGLVARLDEPGSVTRALQRGLDDPGELQRLARAGWDEVVQNHSIEAVTDRWIAALDQVSHHPGAR